MTEQTELELEGGSRVAEEAADGTPLWWKIQALVPESESLFIKKLSRNDTSWTSGGSNQAGFYVPRPIRDAEFLPTLKADNPAKPHIFHAEVGILWPQTGEITRSQIRHFSNKGAEVHITRVARSLFKELTPASLLLMGRFKTSSEDMNYWAVVIDSASEEAELLETVFDLDASFHYAIFAPSKFHDYATSTSDELNELIEEFRSAIRGGTIDALVAKYATIPNPSIIAERARNEWLATHRLSTFDPWVIATPGDAIMEISREIEYRLYRHHELRRRTSELLSILHGSNDLPTGLIQRYPELDQVLLSASQQRKTRAGRSFEHHIAASLTAGRIRFVEQAVTGGRRPDFVLPDLHVLRSRKRGYAEALVLSAKTTLRERWKQVSSEKLNCEVFLATVDDRVAANSIREMAASGIRLVVPETLKTSDEAHYKGQPNVMSFRDFFDGEIRRNRPFLLLGMK
ncbi:type II restriction endonuclease [Aerolutibacter ruishenii]|uniref:Restriction endonuclease EcoRII n=1 Tax=Aerolutibacter ruishenii TaxID=686800 RepID=A0A562LWK4_9GAMM|nr:type II restriction endonuclease [Lysobacter ruishenii]TWI11986.1 restriction endonuclease EcoRII [Lysobacter ruishenii]